ncbi:hypothetical protein ACFQFC_08790 [Amorphoplanes digitatis]|uniref:Uncharacterized protein n=1 Tax=Actinoplanes digitatis TaxID=1868 RepID=A0A7W7I0U3_9ACTN|nr:hypothetical protein [Actinoplanes digitatis]MBB4764304.1 hypothetical protein [Actinoplanes digitatis]
MNTVLLEPPPATITVPADTANRDHSGPEAPGRRYKGRHRARKGAPW